MIETDLSVRKKKEGINVFRPSCLAQTMPDYIMIEEEIAGVHRKPATSSTMWVIDEIHLRDRCCQSSGSVVIC